MTLIELLVVVGIIGILAAIAVPQFAAYRKSAYAAYAKADLRNAIPAMENYFIENGTYTDSIETLKERGLRLSQGVELKAEVTGDGYKLTAKVAPCNGEISYSNMTGKIEGEVCK